MRRIAFFAAILLLPLTLAACGSNSGAAAEDETKVKEAVAFLATADGTPGIFVKGRDVVLNYASRPPTFADAARKAALDASKATGGKAIKVYVVDSPDVATAVPAAGQFYCSISADDGRMAGNNC
jgi:ABC-type glycerol-3-phosphate transport system substrate-binding protein